MKSLPVISSKGMPPREYRVAIVDDEPIARLGLRRLIGQLANVTLVGEARSGPEAMQLLREHHVDILFLDIHMPGADAFDVLARVPADRVPVVVLVTAFQDYAVRAFDLDVADYLHKPFDAARFARAWDRACTAHTARVLSATSHSEAAQERREQLVVPSGRERPLLLRRDGYVHVVALREVEWIEAAHNSVRVHTARGVFTWRQSLHALATRLARAGFVRVHRSALVNIAAILHVQVTRSGDGQLELSRGSRVPLSRRYRSALEQLLRP